MENKLKEQFINYLEEIEIDLSEMQIEKFNKYMKLLLEWNEKINLTAITEPTEIILKHFVDSLTILKYIKPNEKIIDVGTGAGFPGIPIAILKENNEICLMDSLNKRINFLNDVKEKLDLKNIKNIHSRAEDLGKDKKYRQSFDIVTSRAVANLSTLVEYLLPLVKISGYAICMKGANIEKEIEEAKFAIKELGGKIESIEKFYLPNTDITRNIIIIKKEKNTMNKYPRKAGMPAKQPLKP